MARVNLLSPEELTGKAKEAYDDLNSRGKITNMKLVMLQDYGTYLAFMGWYDSWESLVNIVGLRAATIYAHSVSTTNGCMLCSLFFISDLRELGLDPDALELEENELILQQLGQQIVAIVGFAAQMQATNNFNSVLGVDVDERLLPLKGQFKPATWRENIK